MNRGDPIRRAEAAKKKKTGAKADARLARARRPELRRQVFGYWIGPDEDVPDRPVGPPTGAVLPRLGSSLRDAELLCLDLVPVDNYWIVLSELGGLVYPHAAGMLHGEAWVFVPDPEVLGVWPARFVARRAELVVPSVLARYGAEAEVRARRDASSVQLRLRRTEEVATISDVQLLELGRAALATAEPTRDDWVARQRVPIALGLTRADPSEVDSSLRWCEDAWRARFGRA